MTAALKAFIKGVDYSDATKQLTVVFQTSTYIYHGVPADVGKRIGDEFESAEVERLFYSTIEGKYKSERITA